jgi:hypothetical protein
MNAKAPLDDQRTVLVVMRCLETPPEESVRESELVRKSSDACVAEPAECITELITTGYVYRVKGPSGVFIRRTED